MRCDEVSEVNQSARLVGRSSAVESSSGQVQVVRAGGELGGESRGWRGSWRWTRLIPGADRRRSEAVQCGPEAMGGAVGAGRWQLVK
jgi:hypothetical protein